MALTQFVKCALIPQNGGATDAVIFSPIVEGVADASAAILQTSVGEEIVVEDNQTVFTSVDNTITIVSTLSDADAIKINDWLANDKIVGFAGYTIGGLVYMVTLYDDFSFNPRLLDVQATLASGSRGDAFYISSFMRVSEVKQVYKITLTQRCLQGYSPLGLNQGVQLNANGFNACGTTKNITASGGGTPVAPLQLWGEAVSATSFYQGLTFTPSGSGFRITVNDSATGYLTSNLYFPFSGTFAFGVTGNGTTPFNYIDYNTFDASGGVANNDNSSLATGAGSTVGFSIQTSESIPYIQLRFAKSATATGLMNLTDLSLTLQ